mgnify:CR=1 FL=1
MVYWTASSGNRYNVNLDYNLIKAMQKAGARFCFMNDNPGIINEEDETFYETKQFHSTTTDKTNETTNSHRVLREGITVVTENGEQVTGYVAHWVRNYYNETPGTDIQNWFIFQPGTYPTHYIIEKPNHSNSEIVITDL